MEIESHIEKIEEKYYDVFFKFKIDEFECNFTFALIDENIDNFIDFVDKIHKNGEDIPFLYLTIRDNEDLINIRYENRSIVMINNFIQFHFKNIDEILSHFMKICKMYSKT